jgi:TRAP-type C4-dicarboxylate transport system permease small subunit
LLANFIGKITKVFGTMLLLMLVVCVLLQILFRFVLKISVPWTEELARIITIWITIIGLAIIEEENIQIRTTWLVSRISSKYQKMWKVIMSIFNIIFLIVFFIGCLLMYQKANNIMLGSMPFLNTSIIYVPGIIAVPLTIIFLLKQIRDFEKFTDI